MADLPVAYQNTAAVVINTSDRFDIYGRPQGTAELALRIDGFKEYSLQLGRGAGPERVEGRGGVTPSPSPKMDFFGDVSRPDEGRTMLRVSSDVLNRLDFRFTADSFDVVDLLSRHQYELDRDLRQIGLEDYQLSFDCGANEEDPEEAEKPPFEADEDIPALVVERSSMTNIDTLDMRV